MNNSKEIFTLLKLTANQPFKIINPCLLGIYKLTDELYIQKQIGDNEWEYSVFQLCDLFNGTVKIEPMVG